MKSPFQPLILLASFATVHAASDFKTNARELINQQKWSLLLTIAEKELSGSPDSVDALLALGVAKSNLGKTEEAQSIFDRAKGIIKKEMESLYNQGLLFASSGDRDNLLDTVSRLSSMESSNVWRTGARGPNTPRPTNLFQFLNEPSVSKVLCNKTVTDVDFRNVKIAFQPPPPPYPPLAKIAKIQGTVIVQVVVDASGIPVSVLALDGPPQLRPAAESYTALWRFGAPDDFAQKNSFRFKIIMPFQLR